MILDRLRGSRSTQAVMSQLNLTEPRSPRLRNLKRLRRGVSCRSILPATLDTHPQHNVLYVAPIIKPVAKLGLG